MQHRRSASLLAALLAGVALAACDDGESQVEARLRAAQAAADPPQLWSVQVVGEARNGRPVLICADTRLRSGFTSVVPAQGGRSCARFGQPTTPAAPYRCLLDGTIYGVASTTTGDPRRDFEVGSTIHPLIGEGVDYGRTLRFRLIAPRCPKGWDVGDADDQRGRRVHDAVEMDDGPSTPPIAATPPEPLAAPIGLADRRGS